MPANLLQRIFALIVLVLSAPFLFISWVIVKLEDGGPLIFKQKRMGKDSSVFILYKLRSMVEGAEAQKEKYLHLNETDGPVFKIRQDPRYTKYGRFLAQTGLDETPQLVNVIRGEMAFVGPRPLPVEEAKRVPGRYKKRMEVLPGITSPWVIKGAHELSFREWMELDLDYVEKKSYLYDLKVAVKTSFLIARSLAREALSFFR